ncbi:MAG: F-box protein [Gemmobacter sp.]
MTARKVHFVCDLPDDAWTIVLRKLSLTDKCAAALVCRQLARVAVPLISLARPVCIAPGGPLPKRHVAHLVANKVELSEALALAARALAGCTADKAHFSGDDARVPLEKLVNGLAGVPPARLPSISLDHARLCGPNPAPSARKRAELCLLGWIEPCARPGHFFRCLRLLSHIGPLPSETLQGLSGLTMTKCSLGGPSHFVGLEALTVLDITDVVSTEIVLADLPFLEELRVSGTTVHSLAKCPRLARVVLRFGARLLRAETPVLASLFATCTDPHWSLRAVRRTLIDCILGDVPTLPDLEVLHAIRTPAKSLGPQPALREIVATDNRGAWRWDKLPALESCELRGLHGKACLGALPRLRRLIVHNVFTLKATPVHLYPLLEELTLIGAPNPIGIRRNARRLQGRGHLARTLIAPRAGARKPLSKSLILPVDPKSDHVNGLTAPAD